MGNVSQNFNRSEFACKCGCGFSTVDVDLIKVLEVVRRRFGKPITINSACRCEDHNKNIGGSYGSKHKQGIAADIVVKMPDRHRCLGTVAVLADNLRAGLVA